MSGSVVEVVARLAMQTGIAPNDLLDTPPEIFEAMCVLLAEGV